MLSCNVSFDPGSSPLGAYVIPISPIKKLRRGEVTKTLSLTTLIGALFWNSRRPWPEPVFSLLGPVRASKESF